MGAQLRRPRFIQALIPDPPKPELAVGQSVRHTVYGPGIITAIEGEGKSRQVRLKMRAGHCITLGDELARELYSD
jgi:hypothetical protein